MKCEICQINEASVHFKQVNDGETREMYVCEQCASKNGFDPESPIALTDFLFGVGMQTEPVPRAGGKKCDFCGMTGEEFHEKSRVGCQFCYEVFASDLALLLESVHKGMKHLGKIPASAVSVVELESLKRALKAAVSHEDFEEAAMLRDRIHELSGGEKV